MGNRPCSNYDYSRPGVAMLTLKALPGTRLCRITQDNFELTATGHIAQRELLGIPNYYSQIKIGNRFLIGHPRRVLVQFSRRTAERDWPAIAAQLDHYVGQGYVFVSPFISPVERRCLQTAVAEGGRAIRLTHRFFGARYKPAGMLFDGCAQGRLLEVSVAGAFPRFARLDREACLRLNEVAAVLATTQWSQGEGAVVAR